jgi:opacity protein-like surface antigen
MRTKFRLLSAVAMLAALSAPGYAADLNEIIPAPVIEDNYVPVEIGNGWYIRGDISYDLSTSATGNYLTYDGVAFSTNPYDNFDLGSAFDVSIGAGYQFNPWLRTDATLTYWGRDVNGTDTSPAPCTTFATTADPTAINCRSVDTTRIAAWESMANVYADLGTYVGITPYIGAGAGFTHISYSDLTNTSYCTNGAGSDVPVAGNCPLTSYHEGAKSWRFTWALSAGASYDLTKNTKIDLGYRYSRVAGGDMFNWPLGTVGVSGVQGEDDGFSQHTFKAGIRYALW